MKLLTQLSAVIAPVGEGVDDRAPTDVVILSLYARSRDTFNTVCLLLDNGRALEAASLTRGLFTDSLMLEELASFDADRRGQRALQWELKGLQGLADVTREAEHQGLSGNRKWRAEIEAERSQAYEALRKRAGKLKPWSPDEKQLAKRHGRGEEYVDFRMLHLIVHGSTFALRQHRRWVGDVLEIGGPPPAWWFPAVAGMSSAAMARGTRATCSMFGWAEPEQLAALESAAEELE